MGALGPGAHPLSCSSPSLALVMEGMEDAEADCSVAFAEAQRWVEVSVFSSSLQMNLHFPCLSLLGFPTNLSLRPSGDLG